MLLVALAAGLVAGEPHTCTTRSDVQGYKIGEASKPGPGLNLDDPEDDCWETEPPSSPAHEADGESYEIDANLDASMRPGRCAVSTTIHDGRGESYDGCKHGRAIIF